MGGTASSHGTNRGGGGINIFFSGKANGSNRKHLRTGDRNRSDCIAVTDNVAQACRLQEVTAIYGRKALKGRGGKFHPNNVPAGWTHTQQVNNSPKQHTHTHKNAHFPSEDGRLALFFPYLYPLTLIKCHRTVPEVLIIFLANRLPYRPIIMAKIMTTRGIVV